MIQAYQKLPKGETGELDEALEIAYSSLAQCQAKINLLIEAIKWYQDLLIDRPFGQYDEIDEDSIDEDAGNFNNVNEGDASIEGKVLVKVHKISKSSRDEGESLLVTVSTDGHERFTEKLKRRERCKLNGEGVEFDLSTSGGPVSYFEILIRTKSLDPVGLIFFKLSWLIEPRDKPLKFSDVLGLEPDGLIHLEILFLPKPKPKTIFNGAEVTSAELTRQNAIKMKRISRFGHVLVAKKVYQLKKCAVCHEFLYQTSAYRCESILTRMILYM